MILTIQNIIVKVANLVLGIIAFFLLFRFVFKLLGANPTTPFVSWINRVSENLVYPFSGIFPDILLGGSSAIDVVALIALLAYSALAYIALSLLNGLIDSRYRTVHHTPATGDHYHTS